MEPLDFMDPEPPIEIQKELSSDPVCPDCGDTGIGLLGIHEWVEWLDHPDTPEQPYPMYHEQEEYGTPCPTCGRVADNES